MIFSASATSSLLSLLLASQSFCMSILSSFMFSYPSNGDFGFPPLWQDWLCEWFDCPFANKIGNISCLRLFFLFWHPVFDVVCRFTGKLCMLHHNRLLLFFLALPLLVLFLPPLLPSAAPVVLQKRIDFSCHCVIVRRVSAIQCRVDSLKQRWTANSICNHV
jgi:hypothetical protein